jgi:transposase-like protein
MKQVEREQARELRRAGHSVKEICRELGVAKSSVSVWVRDIELTEEQLLSLKRRSPIYHGQHNGSKAVAAKHRELRRQYQEEGRMKAREGDPLHLAGCMLYWGEGAKARNSLTLANSDPDMLIYFMKFIREALLAEVENVAIRIICYLGNNLTVQEIEGFWLERLELPSSCLKNTTVNRQPVSSQQKGRKLLYGTCEVAIHNTRLVQQVFGAIQEYTGIEKPEWLM